MDEANLSTDINILVMDDEKTVQESLKIILEYQGYNVIIANTASEGFELIEKHNFNLLILDLKMPDMNGFDILKSVRKNHPELKVILITGYGTLDIARQALAMGAIYYFDKPIDLDRFISRVKKAVT